MTTIRNTLAATALLAALTPAARAHTEVSEASALSMLPVAVSVAAPSMILGAGAVLTVVSVQASATGTVWVLERASDGGPRDAALFGSCGAGRGAVDRRRGDGHRTHVGRRAQRRRQRHRLHPQRDGPRASAQRAHHAMNALHRLTVTLAVAAAATGAHAGRPCEARPATTNDVVRGMTLAAATAARLDASGAQVVVLARAGQDLSK